MYDFIIITPPSAQPGSVTNKIAASTNALGTVYCMSSEESYLLQDDISEDAEDYSKVHLMVERIGSCLQ